MADEFEEGGEGTLASPDGEGTGEAGGSPAIPVGGETPAAPEAPAEERLYAGAYRTPEDMEKALIDLKRTISRQGYELGIARRQLTPEEAARARAEAEAIAEGREPPAPVAPAPAATPVPTDPGEILETYFQPQLQAEMERAEDLYGLQGEEARAHAVGALSNQISLVQQVAVPVVMQLLAPYLPHLQQLATADLPGLYDPVVESAVSRVALPEGVTPAEIREALVQQFPREVWAGLADGDRQRLAIAAAVLKGGDIRPAMPAAPVGGGQMAPPAQQPPAPINAGGGVGADAAIERMANNLMAMHGGRITIEQARAQATKHFAKGGR